MAVCAVTLGFTSCEKKADPVTQPIAGNTYIHQEGEEYFKITFLMDYKCIQEAKSAATGLVRNDRFVWEMTGNKIIVRYAPNTMDVNTGENLSNKLMYTGEYDADKKQIVLTMVDAPEVSFICKQMLN